MVIFAAKLAVVLVLYSIASFGVLKFVFVVLDQIENKKKSAELKICSAEATMPKRSLRRALRHLVIS
jgi:hypothetical protein